MSDDNKSYFVIDMPSGHATGPFDKKESASSCIDLISNVKRGGYLVITECTRIEELEQI